jgi:hypothetical protein
MSASKPSPGSTVPAKPAGNTSGPAVSTRPVPPMQVVKKGGDGGTTR